MESSWNKLSKCPGKLEKEFRKVLDCQLISSVATLFILAFSLVQSSSFVIMEYAVLNKDETTLSLQLVQW